MLAMLQSWELKAILRNIPNVGLNQESLLRYHDLRVKIDNLLKEEENEK
jgi:hypothetical protein